MIKLLTKKQKAAKKVEAFNRNRVAENAAKYPRKPVFIRARAAKKARLNPKPFVIDFNF